MTEARAAEINIGAEDLDYKKALGADDGGLAGCGRSSFGQPGPQADSIQLRKE